MARRHQHNPFVMLADIFQEVSIWMSIGLVTGLTLGAAAGGWWVYQIFSHPGPKVIKFTILVVLTCLILGMFGGIALGAVFDGLMGWVLGKKDPRDKKKRR